MAGYDPTPEQKDILKHDIRRHARVLAGPGTGKSATMVALLERILGNDEPPRVKLVTFTRAATAELAEKVGGEEDAVHRPSTMHSFAISVLLRNPGTSDLPRPLRMADDWELRYIVRETLKRRTSFKIKELERLEAEMASAWEALRKEDKSKFTAAQRKKYEGAWQQHRSIYGYTLLAELPFALRQALSEHDDLVGVDFDLLVVDEYQDLNACDLEVLRRLAQNGCRVLAAGDDDQSIYSFRRADPEGIRRFHEDYPGSEDYTLSVTLRCGKQIIKWANHVIAGDPSRPDDRAFLDPLGTSPEGDVAHLAFKDNKAEARGIAQLVRHLRDDEGVDPSQVLVLVASDDKGRFSRPIREELAKLGIKCTDPGEVKELLARPSTRGFLAFLKLCAGEAEGSRTPDSLAWATLVHLESGLSTDKFLDYLYDLASPSTERIGATLLRARDDDFPGAPGRTGTAATALVDRVLAWFEGNDVPKKRPKSGWTDWARDVAKDAPVGPPDGEFFTLLEAVEEGSDERVTLGRLLGQLYPVGKDFAATKSDGVRVMTMASSKGLTVRATIVASLDNVVMPRPDVDHAEARRLLYVAMTRSKEYLYVTWAKRRKGQSARAGKGSLERRSSCPFLRTGPVSAQSGEDFLKERW